MYMKKIILLSVLLMSVCIMTLAQTLETQTFSTGNGNLPSVGSTFDVPINVTDIGSGVDVVNMTIYLNIDPEVVSYQAYNDGISGVIFTVTPQNSDTRLMIEVNSSVGLFQPFEVPDGKLVDLEFTFNGGDSDFDFGTTNNLPASTYSYLPFTSYSFTDADVTNGGVYGGVVDNTIAGGTWGTATDWSLGVVPNTWHNVIVATGGVSTIGANAVADAVTVQDGGQLTLGAFTLAVDNDFTIESGGSYIENGTLTAGGAVTMERMIAGYGGGDDLDGWHFLSSPVNAQSMATGGFTTDPANVDFYRWNESTATWENWIVHSWATFTVGKGYLVAYETGGTKTFTADANGFNTASVGPIAITNNGADPQGFNLLGNPFPSALMWDDSWAAGSVATYAKIWRESSASYVDIADGGTIPALNGFMVYSFDATQNVTIDAADRMHSGTAWYKNEEQQIMLLAHDMDQNVYQESIIKFDDNATPGYDQYLDSRFLYGYAPAFYSLADEVSTSVNAMAWNQDLIIPFNFEKNASSNFMIELAESIEGENVYLKDLKTNTTVNLTETGTYTFSSEEGDDPDRFEILFGVVGIEDIQPLAAAHVYSNGDVITIANVEGETRMDVMDVQGRMMQSNEFTSNGYTTVDVELPAGIYLVRLYNSGEAKTTKVFVK